MMRSICLVAGGFAANHIRLQPWRYLHETARQLSMEGHRVQLISDGTLETESIELLHGVPICHLPSVRNPWWQPNVRLRNAICMFKPDVILWHIGLTSALHQSALPIPDVPVIGIFTTPVYRLKDLARPGIAKLLFGHNLSLVHLIGTLVPGRIIRARMRPQGLRRLVVQTETTARRLQEDRLWPGPISVIPPGVDEIWGSGLDRAMTDERRLLGYSRSDTVILYFGSPAPLRGLPTLLQALAVARQKNPSLKLLILNRSKQDKGTDTDTSIEHLLRQEQLADHIQTINGFLTQETLVQYVAASDVVALPFELVPSDAPLSLLEARALGKPIVTTTVGCLPELAGSDNRYLAPPADPPALAEALLHAAAKRRHQQVLKEGDARNEALRSWKEVGREWAQLLQSV